MLQWFRRAPDSAETTAEHGSAALRGLPPLLPWINRANATVCLALGAETGLVGPELVPGQTLPGRTGDWHAGSALHRARPGSPVRDIPVPPGPAVLLPDPGWWVLAEKWPS